MRRGHRQAPTQLELAWAKPPVVGRPPLRVIDGERLHVRNERCISRGELLSVLFGSLAPHWRVATREQVQLALAWAASESSDAILSGSTSRSLSGMGRAIGVLARSAVTPDRFARVAHTHRLQRLAHVYQETMRRLESSGLVHPACVGLHVASLLAQADPHTIAETLHAEAIVAEPIARWEPVDLLWWAALSRVLRRIGGDAVIRVAGLDTAWTREREAHAWEVLTEQITRALGDAPEFETIRAPLGDLTTPESIPSMDTVEVHRAPNEEVAAKAIVRLVLEALASGAAIDGVAVALAHPTPTEVQALVHACKEAGIPAGFGTNGPMRAGIVGMALRAVTLAEAPLTRLGIAELLRSPYVRMGDNLATRLASALERSSTRNAPDTLGALEATVRAATSPEEADALAPVLVRLVEALVKTGTTQPVHAHVEAARSLWDLLALAPRMSGDVRRALRKDEERDAVTSAELEAVAFDARGFAALTETLDAWERAAGAMHLQDTPIASVSFWEQVLAMLDHRGHVSAAHRAGAVRILSLADFACEPLSLLVIAGASEDRLPVRPRVDPWLTDAVRRDLSRLDPLRAPLPTTAVTAQEEAELLLAVSRASRVAFVYAEGEDGDTSPARIVRWLEARGAKSCAWSNSPHATPIVTARDARLTRLITAGEGSDASVKRRAFVEQAREAYFFDPARKPSPLTGHLDRPREGLLRAETGGSDRPLGVTKLELFATCAFAGYASAILRAKEREIVPDAPDAREQGNLLHAALAQAFTATQPLWEKRPRPQETIRERSRDAAAAVLDVSLHGSVFRRLAFTRAMHVVMSVVDDCLADPSWDFALAEVAFGNARDSWPALAFDTVRLRGTMDRVDRHHETGELRVVDYKKSESGALRALRQAGTTALQLPLYALVAEKNLGAPCTSASYASLERRTGQGPRFRVVRDLAEFTGGSPPGIQGVIEDLLTRIRRGELSPNPYAESVCTHCAFDGACRKPRFSIPREEEEGEATGG